MDDAIDAAKQLSAVAEMLLTLETENRNLRAQLLKQTITLLDTADVIWVVNNLGELGVKIGCKFFFMYKGESLVYLEQDRSDQAYKWRKVEKREFGEVCRAPEHAQQIRDHGVDKHPWPEYTSGGGWELLPFPPQ